MKLQIIDWDKHFESAKSRERDRCSYVCVPNKQHGLGLSRLLSEVDGLFVYGVWCLILGACSRQKRPRGGYLTDTGRVDGCPWSARDMALMWRCTEEQINRAIVVLTSPKIGWVKDLDAEDQQGSIEYPPSTRQVPAKCPPDALEWKGKEGKGREEIARAPQEEETPAEGGETPPAAPTARRPDFVGFADAWASLERWCRRGSRFGLPVGHDTERVILTLRDALEQQPPIIHGDQPVNQWLLVPLAVESLVQDDTRFMSIDYACKCVKNRLDEWAKNGIHKENGNGQSRTGNNAPPRRRRPGEAVDAGLRL